MGPFFRGRRNLRVFKGPKVVDKLLVAGGPKKNDQVPFLVSLKLNLKRHFNNI